MKQQALVHMYPVVSLHSAPTPPCKEERLFPSRGALLVQSGHSKDTSTLHQECRPSHGSLFAMSEDFVDLANK